MEPLVHSKVDTVHTYVSHPQPHFYKIDKYDHQEGSLGVATFLPQFKACELRPNLDKIFLKLIFLTTNN